MEINCLECGTIRTSCIFVIFLERVTLSHYFCVLFHSSFLWELWVFRFSGIHRGEPILQHGVILILHLGESALSSLLKRYRIWGLPSSLHPSLSHLLRPIFPYVRNISNNNKKNSAGSSLDFFSSQTSLFQDSRIYAVILHNNVARGKRVTFFSFFVP